MVDDDKWFAANAEREETHAPLQWKGTDACFDFTCECGVDGHFDGFFASQVRCPGCGTIWEMPFILFPRRRPDPDAKPIIDLEPEE